MSIQWFPGHMHKSKLALQELITNIDVVVELLDARAPFASCNPLLQNIIKHKKKIRILNKSDLADDKVTQAWVKYFTKENNTIVIKGSMYNKKQAEQLIKMCKKLSPSKNSFEKPLRIMVTGIPNVGKSTLINQIIGKKSAKTGDVPAVTKANQRLFLSDNVIVYDTPGMMWQKIRYPQVGYNLALCNSIGKNALDEELLALFLLEYLSVHYPKNLLTRYKLTEQMLKLSASELLTLIGKKRGAIMSGGIIDKQKAAELIIQDFRAAKIGQISLETTDLWEKWLDEFEDVELIEEQESTESDF